MRSDHKKRFWLVSLCFMLMLPFQNCSQGFKAFKAQIESSSSTSSTGLGLEAYQAKAMTILTLNCKSCHVDQSLGNVTSLLDVNHLLTAGLVQPGKPADSPLLQAIEANRMPPSGPLSSEDKLALKNWILALGGLSPDGTAIDFGFTMTISLDPLPFRTRLAKVSRLPSTPASLSLAKLQTNRYLLGDYDFARTIVPRFSWEASDMKNWLENVEPVCSSSEVRNRFPWPAGVQPFFSATLGRLPNSVDDGVVQEISALTVPDPEKFDILCLTVLSSLEFVAK